jgi:hypothetical protein
VVERLVTLLSEAGWIEAKRLVGVGLNRRTAEQGTADRRSSDRTSSFWLAPFARFAEPALPGELRLTREPPLRVLAVRWRR